MTDRHLSHYRWRCEPRAFVQNCLWEIIFQSFQVALSDERQVLRVIRGFGLAARQISLNKSINTQNTQSHHALNYKTGGEKKGSTGDMI